MQLARGDVSAYERGGGGAGPESFPKCVDLLVGDLALSEVMKPEFIAEWRRLLKGTSGATFFQSPEFVLTWYEHYMPRYEPVIVAAYDSSQGAIKSLWTLARHRETARVCFAGDHQAEYQSWLCGSGATSEHIAEVLNILFKRFAIRQLRVRYFRDVTSAKDICESNQLVGRTILRFHRRPLARLDPIAAAKSLSKKNKTRISRLGRLGNVELVVATAATLGHDEFDWLAACYDVRQAAAHGVAPFTVDALKRDFHLALLSAAPNDISLTLLRVGHQIAAGLWAARTGEEMHLVMLIYSPLLAEHSPGKLHLLMLAQALAESHDAATILDLTPGGDPWKERFADMHDQVAEITIYAKRVNALRDRLSAEAVQLLGRAIKGAGLEPSRIRKFARRALTVTPTKLLRAVRRWTFEDVNYMVFRQSRVDWERTRSVDLTATAPRPRMNEIQDLLRFEPLEPWRRHDDFIREALARIERGEVSYTITIDGILAHYGWMVRDQSTSLVSEVGMTLSLPKGSFCLYDFYTHPRFRGRGLYRANLRHMLEDGFEAPSAAVAYIGVLANNHASRRVIESSGFEQVGLLTRRRRLGRETKQSDIADQAISRVAEDL